MNHDLLHIQGKPYMLVPLHEYRMLAGSAGQQGGDLPEDIKDTLFAGSENPVKILRKYRSLTQAELAQSAGLSRPYLTEIETGKKNGSIAALKAIAEALRVDAGLLIS